MAVSYSFLRSDDIVKTEDIDFITLCQVSSLYYNTFYTIRKVIHKLLFHV